MSQGDNKNLGERLLAGGWRTGSVIKTEHAAQIAPLLQRAGEAVRALGAGEQLIVISQTCDIVAEKLTQEPYVEVLVAGERSAIDSPKANLRTTRYLSFRPKQGRSTFLEARATDRFWVPRQLFDGQTPDTSRSLDAAPTLQVCKWLGLRYTRPAWPNALVQRLPKKDIETALRRVSLTVSEIWVGITDKDKELPENQSYRLSVFAVMEKAVWDAQPQMRQECAQAIVDFANLLRRCKGIEVMEAELLPGDKFSWQMMRMCDLWNFANLTSEAENA